MKALHLLIVSAGAAREYREYLLKSISQRYRITLLDHRTQQWTRTYVHSQIPLDIFDSRAFDEVTAAHEKKPFDGVLCYDESRILLAAKLAESLGLRSGGSAAVTACRDKHLTRVALERAGIRQPRSIVVHDLLAAIQAAETVGYPVVLKPRALMASEGVVIVENAAQLEKAYEESAGLKLDVETERADDSMLIEEYVDGPEFSVDGAVIAGEYVPLFIAEKSLDFPPYFEEIAHKVDALNQLMKTQSFRDTLQEIHTALGLITTMTHVEFRMTPGGLSVIEVNARLGGDLIPRVGWYATGIDAGLVAASIAVGETPDLEPSISRAAKIRFYYPSGPTVIDNVRWAPVDDVIEVGLLVEPGDTIDIPPAQFVVGRVAYAIALSDDQTHLERALREFGEHLMVAVTS